MKKKLLTEKQKKVLLATGMVVFTIFFVCEPGFVVNATGQTIDISPIMEPFNLLTSILTSIVSSIGTAITLWGIGEWGMAFQGSDGTMQAHAFKRLGGGFIMVMAPQILAVLV